MTDQYKNCVRDVSWHPTQPAQLVSTSVSWTSSIACAVTTSFVSLFTMFSLLLLLSFFPSFASVPPLPIFHLSLSPLPPLPLPLSISLCPSLHLSLSLSLLLYLPPHLLHGYTWRSGMAFYSYGLTTRDQTLYQTNGDGTLTSGDLLYNSIILSCCHLTLCLLF